jgi:hypothetical protein
MIYGGKVCSKGIMLNLCHCGYSGGWWHWSFAMAGTVQWVKVCQMWMIRQLASEAEVSHTLTLHIWKTSLGCAISHEAASSTHS